MGRVGEEGERGKGKGERGKGKGERGKGKGERGKGRGKGRGRGLNTLSEIKGSPATWLVFVCDPVFLLNSDNRSVIVPGRFCKMINKNFSLIEKWKKQRKVENTISTRGDRAGDAIRFSSFTVPATVPPLT